MEPTDIKIENTKKTTAWERKSFVMKQWQKRNRAKVPPSSMTRNFYFSIWKAFRLEAIPASLI
jgi:hypothetical protein